MSTITAKKHGPIISIFGKDSKTMHDIAKKQGFSLERTVKIDEISATLYELRHIKTGAELIYLDREDENKTFSVAFPTPPEDSTGVFHIIEHSVLCGSEKYPLKDPFAELLKGSLNTFLNAMTYEDRTVYPVSSRCERDFLNLVDVYLDAVFAPKLLTNPSIFSQEGWHYEYDEQSHTLSYNGVVYNEMKGAYSSPDEVGVMALSRALYSDSIYRHDSGGSPEAIPDLTYEKFKAAHRKYYHPTSAKIVLDGKMDVEKLLSLIDGHICRFERGEAIAPPKKSTPKIAQPEYVKFEISENEDEKGRARVLFGFVYSDFSDKEAQLTATILSDLLCGSNAAPLKKALLERGLCKDAIIYSNRAESQTVTLEIRDTDAEALPEIERTVSEVIRGLARDGIDREQLSSIISSIEFKTKERDFGTLPSGIAYALSVYSTWNYGGLPEDSLTSEDTIESIKSKIDSGYFERELLKMTLDNPHRATVVMIPDKELGTKLAEKEKERLSCVLNSLSEKELLDIIAKERLLRSWQEEDEEDKLSCIPALSLSDIPKKSPRAEIQSQTVDGVKIAKVGLKKNGIVYISMHFDASDLSGEELTTLSILASCLTNFPTKSYDTLSLQSKIKSSLGRFFVSSAVAEKDGIVTPYIKVGAGVLSSKCDELVELSREVLLYSLLDDERELCSIVAQAKSQIEDAIIASGESVALGRVEASLGELGSINEHLTGYEAFKLLTRCSKDSGAISDLLLEIKKLFGRIFTKQRMSVIVGGDFEDAFIEKLISVFPEGDSPVKAATTICAEKSEYFLVPSKVSHAVLGNKSESAREKMGLLRVARSILSYEYLWSTVRVKNGAYGTGFIPRRNGFVAFYSYRDPSPAASINYYRESVDYLRALAASNADLTKFIIGAIGEYDTLLTPRTEFAIATRDYLNGWSTEDEERIKEDMLSVKRCDLNVAADIIEEILTDASLAIVGGAAQLESLPEKPKEIIKI